MLLTWQRVTGVLTTCIGNGNGSKKGYLLGLFYTQHAKHMACMQTHTHTVTIFGDDNVDDDEAELMKMIRISSLPTSFTWLP